MTVNRSHRPYPAPEGPWFMAQTWKNLLFAHWPIDASVMRALLPEQLEPDIWKGTAWVGIVPFRMSGTRIRFLPSLPFASSFLELNLRTYVTFKGRPGVYFFCLDASHRPAVEVARKVFHLPYFYADMHASQLKEKTIFKSVRKDQRGHEARFEAAYGPKPGSNVFHPVKNTFEYWLTERYRLFTTHKGGMLAGEIDHDPWALREAEVSISINNLADVHQLKLPPEEPIVHIAAPQNVRFWSFKSVY
ncbi:hypothetical protein CR205_17770 [Alteribacter lacisalsi]|uniref:DUF2071 domain-containing protein n=1 Tax=Alteribacter lacisalsi TaxID=2045244 RepID=A0A2W0HRI0_9BACI|nr:DUF2071 domain-containing protein [Alteribacter lacisalsi]PYZ96208.1 hypothetical protein CR205_17770 [Alteribacter lacisalsi]